MSLNQKKYNYLNLQERSLSFHWFLGYIIMLFCLFAFTKRTYGQDIKTDTLLARQYFETANNHFGNHIYDTAIIHFEKASILYKSHKLWHNYLQSRIKLSDCYQKQWNLNMAIDILKPSVDSVLSSISKPDIFIADAYSLLGDIYRNKSDYKQALEYHFKGVKLYNELIDLNHIKLAMIYNSIGMDYQDRSEYDKALKYHFKSLAIKKELFKNKHIELARSYNNIGLVYSSKSEYDKALEYYNKSLEIKNELSDGINIGIAHSYNNIGVIYKRKAE